jgi:hypothetical protein
MINNGKIISPINWIIIDKLSEKWEIVGMWTPIITVATNDKIKVLIWIWDELKEKLNLWDNVNIELTEENKQVIWTIKKILPTKNQTTKKIWIEISIDNKNRDIKIWSMAKVYFEDISDSWLIIPNKAIISKFMITWVMVKQWNLAKFREIKIIKQNDSFSLVEELKLSEEIIIEWQENIYDGEVINN